MPQVPTYLLYGESTGKDPEFWLHCETIMSRSSRHHWEIQPHRHESFFQILHIEAGSGDAVLDGGVIPLKPGSAFTVPPRCDHGFRFSRDIDGVVITILSSHLAHQPGDPGDLGRWLAEPRLIDLSAKTPDASHITDILRCLAREFHNRDRARDEILKCYFALALHLLSRLAPDAKNIDAQHHGEARVQSLLALIHRHFRSHRPVSYYADTIGVSVTHLNRLVQAELGCTAHDLITSKLLDEAKRELVFSMTSIQEVGYRLGFDDAAYFSRFFLKQTGLNPSKWRVLERARVNA